MPRYDASFIARYEPFVNVVSVSLLPNLSIFDSDRNDTVLGIYEIRVSRGKNRPFEQWFTYTFLACENRSTRYNYKCSIAKHSMKFRLYRYNSAIYNELLGNEERVSR